MNKLRTSLVVVSLFVLLAHGQETDQMSARKIMDRVASVYSSCRTYSDEGQLSVDFVGSSGYVRRQREQPFFTAFVRSSGFRYEFWMRRGTHEWDRFIAWKNGDAEKAWWSLNPHDVPLAKTLLSFAELSGGTAQTIPGLLLPELLRADNVVNSLENPRLAGQGKIDGRAAFKIEGKFRGQTLKLWIDSHEFLILKILKQEYFDQYNIQTTTTYKPLVNVDSASDKLAFNPLANSPSAQSPEPIREKPQSHEKLQADDREINLIGKPKKTDSDRAKDQKKAIVNPDEEDVVRVDTTLVALDVLALDRQGRSVKGLSQTDFVIVEDGQPQQVTTFTLGDDVLRPRTIVLIIDYSGSQLPFIQTSVEAAKTLVDKLNPKDRMAIVTDDVTVLVDFTDDKAKLKKKLDSLWDTVAKGHRLGRSAQYSALMATLKKLTEERSVRPIVIFQTDGDELSLLRPAAGYPSPYPMAPPVYQDLGSAFSIVDVFAAAVRSQTTIYSVVPGIRLIGFSPTEQVARAKAMSELQSSARNQLRLEWSKRPNPLVEKTRSDEDWLEFAQSWVWTQKTLATLAQLSGGWADFLEQPDQSADIYARILSDINGRYIIGYQPANTERDGKLRQVTVEVRGHPEYRVWGRTSYYAPVP